MTEPAVLLERDGHVVTITPHRLEKRKAFDVEVALVTDSWVASLRGPPLSEEKRDEGTCADGDSELCVDSTTVSVARSTQTHRGCALCRLNHGFGNPVDTDEHLADGNFKEGPKAFLEKRAPKFTGK